MGRENPCLIRRGLYRSIVDLYRKLPPPCEDIFENWKIWKDRERQRAYEAAFFEDAAALLSAGLDLRGPGENSREGLLSLLERAGGRSDLVPAQARLLRFLAARVRSFPNDPFSLSEWIVPAHSAGDVEFRRSVAVAFLDRLVDPRVTPAFYDFDHLDDLSEILGSRYACGVDDGESRVAFAHDVLSYLAGRQGTPSDLKPRLVSLLGEAGAARYVPPRDRENPFDFPDAELAAPRVGPSEEYAAFLEANRAYSALRRPTIRDVREPSFFREFEQNHLLLLRTLIDLLKTGRVTAEDEILIVGPRFRDEVVFFREVLGLPKTVGLDLLEDPGYIVAGDMHKMEFASNRFQLVYAAAVLCYSYNDRIVIDEIARVCRKPGYVFLLDSGVRTKGPSPSARSDHKDAETMRRMWYKHRFRTLALDDGRSPYPDVYQTYFSVILELLP